MIILAALISLAVHVVFTWDEQILQPLGDKLSELLPEWIQKPLYSCLPCMGAWYSFVIWIFCGKLDLIDHQLLYELFHIPCPDIGLFPVILGTVGLNSILLLIITYVRAFQHFVEIEEIVAEYIQEEEK